MAAPTNYTPDYDFSAYQATNPAKPLPGHEIDVELHNISNAINGTQTALSRIQRSDGKLQNGSVDEDALAPGLRPTREVLSLADFAFTATTGQTTFTLPETAIAPQNVLVHVNGVRMIPETQYTVAGSTLTLTTAPGNGAQVHGIIIGVVSYQDVQSLAEGAINLERRTVLTVEGETVYGEDTEGGAFSLSNNNHIVFGGSPAGPLTLGVDYTVTAAGALSLNFPVRTGELLHIIAVPRISNSAAQAILNDFEAAVAGYAADAETAATAAAGSATAAATSETAAAGSAAQAASANNYASRALAVTAATSSTWPVGAVIRDSSVSYRYAGSGTAIADMPGWTPHGAASSLHWGAGLGASSATVDDAALAAALAFTTPRREFLTLDGNIYIHDQVSFTGAPLIRGGVRHAIHHVGGPNKAALKCTVEGGAHSGVIDGVVATSTTLTENTDNAFIEFVGDTSSILSNCSFVNNFISNFYSGFISNIDARTTPYGLEGGVNWSKFSGNDFRNVFNGYRFRKGTGTGNTFLADVPRIRPGGSYFSVDPVASGHVAGDVMIGFCHGNGLGGDATFLRIGAGTIYGGQWSLLGNQFDAGMVKPIELPTDHQYTNFNLSGNNWGGASKLGTYIAPLVRSVVDDRDVSRWMAGNIKSSGATGTVSFDVFEIEFGIGDYVGAAFEVEVSAFIPGVGMRFATADYWVESIAGTMTITTMRSAVYVNATGGLGITVTNSGTKKAKVAIGWNKSGGTAAAVSQVNIRGRGVSPFKITRL